MKPDFEVLVTFYTVSAALQLQKILKEESCQVVPVPRQLSSSCGYAARLWGYSSSELHSIFKEHYIEWEAVYSIKTQGQKETYMQIAKAS